MRKALGERFDAFESEVPQSLTDRIFSALPSRRAIIDWSISTVLLILMGFFLELRTNHQVDTASGAPSQERRFIKSTLKSQGIDEAVTAPLPKESSGLTVENADGSRYVNRVVDSSSVSRKTSFSRKATALPRQSERPLTGRILPAGVSQPRTSQSTYWLKPAPPLERIEQTTNNSSDALTAFESVATTAVPVIASVNPLPFRLLDVSSLTLTVPVSSPLSVKSSGQPRRSIWFFSVTPLQTFQLVTLRSTPDYTISDVRFGSAFSWQSKGVKVSAGFERNNVQFLLNYTLSSTTLSYRRALDEFTLPTVAHDPFEVTQSTTPLTLKDNLQWLSVGIRKKKTFRLDHALYTGGVGLEYGWALPTGKSMALTTLSLTKDVMLLDKTRLSIGPYAEFDLTKRTLLPEVWQSRSYRVGVTIGIHYAGK